MQDCMYWKPICGMAQLKQQLVEVWADFKGTTVDKKINQWRKRLTVFDIHSEHMM